jgi:hypothetical protein
VTNADAIEQLDRLPYAWSCAKGRLRPTEPLWAVQLVRIDEHGLSNDDAAFIVEGDSLEYCVTRAVAWAQQQ